MISLPSLPNVDDIDSIWAGFPQIWLHVDLEIFGANMALRRQQHLNVLRRRIENGRQVAGRHFAVL